tara:strand:+ start:323 stop:511 length:189 start_codon:yes stop_codon:yes gene_type:complete
MTDNERIIARRKYMREYMRRRALTTSTRKYPGKPRMNPNFYKGDPNQIQIQFRPGSYRISFD